MSGLRREVVELLERRTLSEKRLRTLQALRHGGLVQTAAPSPGRRRFGWAAVLVAAVLLPTLLWHLLPPRAIEADMPRRIADEAAANHLHLKPLEVETYAIAGIRDYFSDLDFRPVDSALTLLDGLDLLGGRYCSIQGLTAAQLRLGPSPAGPVQTLYQTRYERERFGTLPQLDLGEPPLTLKARGLDVAIWVEQDILFVLIRDT